MENENPNYFKKDKGKVTRVTIEYENHTQTLEGDQAAEWMGLIDNMCHMAQNRGQNPDWSKFEWK